MTEIDYLPELQTEAFANSGFVYLVHDVSGEYWDVFETRWEAESFVDNVTFETLYIEQVPYSYFVAFIKDKVAIYHRRFLLQ